MVTNRAGRGVARTRSEQQTEGLIVSREPTMALLEKMNGRIDGKTEEASRNEVSRELRTLHEPRSGVLYCAKNLQGVCSGVFS